MRLFFWLGLYILTCTMAQAMPVDNVHTTFDVKKANRQFDQINLKLSIENLNRTDLDAAVDTLTKLDSEAEYCVADTQKKLNNLSTLIMPASSTNPDKHSVDQVYINQQKKDLSALQAQCSLFSIRAKEAIEAYRSTSAQFAKKEVLIQGTPLWVAVNQILHDPSTTQINRMTELFFSPSMPPYWLSIGLGSVSIMMAIFLFFKLPKIKLIRYLLKQNTLGVSYVFLLSASMCAGFFLVYQLHMQNYDSPSIIFPAILFSYLLSVLVLVFVFKIKIVKGYCLSYSLNSNLFKTLSIVAVSLGAIGVMGQQLSLSIDASNGLWQLTQFLYRIVTLSAAAYFIHYFCRDHYHYPFIKYHQRAIYLITALWVTADLVIDILGYHHLAMRIIISVLTTLAIASITTLLSLQIHKTYLAFYLKPALHRWLVRYVGYKSGQVFTELFLLKTVSQTLIIGAGIYCICHSMDFTAYYADSLYDNILDGVHFASMIIFPMHIMAGLVTFCLLFLMFRVISTLIVRHNQLEEEEERQVALASISTYFGFSVALLTGLIIAGFNFTGLAIVAGAVSVGIGLGLQSIVNNFVSGLILLIEKPIQPGDRINVDGIEGFVKQIRVRSTHIITPNREDIIIPNSDLITRRVTNYMFSDKNCRISCDINVAYGSDTNLVREVLLTIANLHEDVIKMGRSKPFVLFRSFEANHLVFQLSCLIKDVNKKGIVQSDLNYAIEENFRKHQIAMST